MAKKVRRSNVSKGTLVPLGNGFSLAIGEHPNKVDDIDIGPNNKNGLSVNHGEILQDTGKSIRVFSAEPMLGGVSPTQLLYGGMNPNAVFNVQEQYKQANRIADDGSHYRKGGFHRDDKAASGDKYYDIIKTRRNSIMSALNRAGLDEESINNLTPNILKQQILEGGWRLNRADNNFGGMRQNGNTISFDSEDDFQDAYIKMLDERWHVGKPDSLSWRNAKDLNDWARILNREDLGLTTKEAWQEYNKGRKGNDFVYLYAPQWENGQQPYSQKLRGVSNRTDFYTNLIIDDDKIGPRKPDGSFKKGGIYIKPSKHGTFTAAAKKHGMGVQAFAKKVLANKNNYSSAMVKKANFARNASKWHHLYGGEDSLITPLRERLNVNNSNMKQNKRNKAYFGDDVLLNPTYVYDTRIKLPNLQSQAVALNQPGLVDNRRNMGFILPKPNNILTNPQEPGLAPRTTFSSTIPTTTTKQPTFLNKTGNFLRSGVGMDLLGAGVNAAGSIIANRINANAIKNLKFTPRQYTLLDPVKLKTKINIAPELDKMRETVAGISDAARRTSASSRTAFQKISDARRAGLQSYNSLLGEKENRETALINQDLMNQQQVRQINAKNIMDTINYNIAGKDNLDNTKTQLRAQNNVSLVNNLAGIVAGERGLLARRDARIREANNLTIATLPYLKEFNTLTQDEFVKKHGQRIYDAIINGRSII